MRVPYIEGGLTGQWCRWASCLVAATLLAGCAASPSGVTRAPLDAEQAAAPVEAPVETITVTAPEPPRAQGTGDELQALIQARQVREMRTTYHGNYGASLLFDPDSLTYYVAQFHQKAFGRVVKTTDLAEAEQRYLNYGQEARRLAQPELRRVRLEAEVARAQRQLGDREQDLAGLRVDVERQREQESLMLSQQQQAREQAAALAAREKEARAQLAELQRQIRALEREQTRR